MKKIAILLTVAVLSTATAQQPQPTPQQQYAAAYSNWIQQHMLRIYLYMLGYEHIGP